MIAQSAVLGIEAVSQTYLLDVERRLDLWNVGVEIAFKRLDVDRLSDSSCHD